MVCNTFSQQIDKIPSSYSNKHKRKQHFTVTVYFVLILHTLDLFIHQTKQSRIKNSQTLMFYKYTTSSFFLTKED